MGNGGGMMLSSPFFLSVPLTRMLFAHKAEDTQRKRDRERETDGRETATEGTGRLWSYVDESLFTVNVASESCKVSVLTFATASRPRLCEDPLESQAHRAELCRGASGS